jgi:hypothetical protein
VALDAHEHVEAVVLVAGGVGLAAGAEVAGALGQVVAAVVFGGFAGAGQVAVAGADVEAAGR